MMTRRVLLVLLVCASPFVGLTFAAMVMAWLNAIFSPDSGAQGLLSFIFGMISVTAAGVMSVALAVDQWGGVEGRR